MLGKLSRMKQQAKEKMENITQVEDFHSMLPKFIEKLQKATADYGVSELLGRNKDSTRAERIGVLFQELSGDARLTGENLKENAGIAAEAIEKIAAEEKSFMGDVNDKVVTPLKEFNDSELKTMNQKRLDLKKKRLEMDAAKASYNSKTNKAVVDEAAAEKAKYAMETKTSDHDAVLKDLETLFEKLPDYESLITNQVKTYIELFDDFWTKKYDIIEKAIADFK